MGRKSKKRQNYIPNKKTSGLVGLTVSGTMDIAKNGLGFVRVQGWEKDILVRSDDLKTALNGDEVKVVIEYVSKKGRAEGRVKEVTKRSQATFLGSLQVSDKFAFLVLDKQNIPFDIFIPLTKLNGAKDGDKAFVKILEWGGAKDKNPMGEVIEILSQQNIHQIAMKEILLEHGFPISFPDDVLEEAACLPDILDSDEIAQRKDCRNILTFTIDPADAKDFDDAISFRKLKNGLFEIGVHVADVSYYVQPDTALDKEAFLRATSVYLPDRVLPMLPEAISNELCSLRPHEDKFAFSTIFQINQQGEVKQYWIGRTVIRSQKRYAYEDVQQIIENGTTDEHREIIIQLKEITQKLRIERFRKGAINFSSQEIRFQLDEEGSPIGIIVKESKEAHQLIEELMLLANKHVAILVGKRQINNQPIPFPYRVHDLPDEDKLGVFAAFASRFGYKMNLNSSDQIAKSFNDLLNTVRGKPEQHILEQLGIRTMSKALYTTHNIGHYGLGFDQYCHFTSPIRRYPDIMVHRVLQQCIDEQIQVDNKMEQKAKHCSDQERKAMEAERTADKYKQVEYMQKFIGETFEAVISGIASFGFWAETIEHKCEGLISIGDLPQTDEYVFLENEYALRGLHTGKRFAIGDKIKILVAATNLQKRQIDFEYVEDK